MNFFSTREERDKDRVITLSKFFSGKSEYLSIQESLRSALGKSKDKHRGYLGREGSNEPKDKIQLNLFCSKSKLPRPTSGNLKANGSSENDFQSRYLHPKRKVLKKNIDFDTELDAVEMVKKSYTEPSDTQKQNKIFESLPSSQNYFLINLENLKKPKQKNNDTGGGIGEDLKKITQYEKNMKLLQLCDKGTLDCNMDFRRKGKRNNKFDQQDNNPYMIKNSSMERHLKQNYSLVNQASKPSNLSPNVQKLQHQASLHNKQNKFTLAKLLPERGNLDDIYKKGEKQIFENINNSLNETEKSRISYHEPFYGEDNPAVTFSKFRIKRRTNYVKQNQKFLNSVNDRDFISKSTVATRTVMRNLGKNQGSTERLTNNLTPLVTKQGLTETLLKTFEDEF